MTLELWGAVLLVGLGLLLGLLLEAAARNVLDRALQSKLRQAEERRRLDEAWPAVRTAFQQRGKCPYCTSPCPNGTRTSHRRSSRNNNTETERLSVTRNRASHPRRPEQSDRRRAEQ